MCRPVVRIELCSNLHTISFFSFILGTMFFMVWTAQAEPLRPEVPHGYGLGRPATSTDINAWNIDVSPGGETSIIHACDGCQIGHYQSIGRTEDTTRICGAPWSCMERTWPRGDGRGQHRWWTHVAGSITGGAHSPEVLHAFYVFLDLGWAGHDHSESLHRRNGLCTADPTEPRED